MLSEASLSKKSSAFLNYLNDMLETLPVLPLEKAIPDPGKSAIISIDVINGFTIEGPLSSPRVAAIVQPIARLLKTSWEHGLRNIILVQEYHDPNAVEFEAWPPHAVGGTSEAETVAAFKALPFYEQMTILYKNSVSAFINTGLKDWLDENAAVDTFIAVGDVTDICTYQLAMGLKMNANAHQIQRRVIVPANCVQTYDLSVEAAREIGALPHDGDLLHAVFLYHMALNGIEVVREVE